MSIIIRKFTSEDLAQMRLIWNEVVKEGNAFPQEELLDEAQAKSFFYEQSYTGVAEEDGKVIGLYILHPNNIGRCGHIANASYAVKADQRGKHIGEFLVKDSLTTAASLSFRILQFNAVVATNKGALHLYEKLGFTRLGTVPGGFKRDDRTYEDIILFYIRLGEIDDERK